MSKPSLLQVVQEPFPSAVQHSQEQREERPRLFWLMYDHSKVQTKNEHTCAHLGDKLVYWGVLYPDGGVGLQTGAYFTSEAGLRNYLMNMGEFSIEWIKGE